MWAEAGTYGCDRIQSVGLMLSFGWTTRKITTQTSETPFVITSTKASANETDSIIPLRNSALITSAGARGFGAIAIEPTQRSSRCSPQPDGRRLDWQSTGAHRLKGPGVERDVCPYSITQDLPYVHEESPDVELQRADAGGDRDVA
jgi:hypothetical protein